MFACGRVLKRAFLKKPSSVYAEEEADVNHHGLERKMNLFDLLMIGIGGTMGSGVFALAGLIAHSYSGPAVVCSFMIGGFSCLFSAASYGELSCRIPSAGSSYAYVYNCLGEYFAVIAAWCLTLEYGISSSAVARNWGDKLYIYLALTLTPSDDVNSAITTNTHNDFLHIYLNPENNGGINVFAGVLQLICVFILMQGVDISKVTINFFTVFKIVLIAFMAIAGFTQFDSRNLVPFAPFGMMGIMKGATSCIFGLLGYDEVCCLAAEAQDPHRNLPIAVFGTIMVVSFFYCVAAFALAGMQPYGSISNDSGFTVAFESVGMHWASQLVAIGELVCLPIVVLICFLAQPRFLYAMAEDGLMPKLFSELDHKGNLTRGIFYSGIICVAIAFLVPFTYLDDMISAGVLFSFNLTNSALIVTRKFDPTATQKTEKLLTAFNVIAIIFAFAVASVDIDALLGFASSLNLAHTTTDHHSTNPANNTQGLFQKQTLLNLVISFTFLALAYIVYLLFTQLTDSPDPDATTQYRVPLVPLTPCIGMVINYILIAQQSLAGLGLMCVYFLIATIFYVWYGSGECEWKSNLLETHSSDDDGDGSRADNSSTGNSINNEISNCGYGGSGGVTTANVSRDAAGGAPRDRSGERTALLEMHDRSSAGTYSAISTNNS